RKGGSHERGRLSGRASPDLCAECGVGRAGPAGAVAVSKATHAALALRPVVRGHRPAGAAVFTWKRAEHFQPPAPLSERTNDIRCARGHGAVGKSGRPPKNLNSG